LDDLKNIVKDTLGALANLGIISPEEASAQYVDMSIALMKAINDLNEYGTLSTDIFDNLINIGGVYGKELSELFDLQLQHILALERATQAQKDYDAAVKASVHQEAKTNQLIRDYNTMLRKGADRNTLKNKLKIVNAAQLELAANKRAELAKKDALDIANEQLKIIEEQVKLQESLLKQFIDLAQAQKEAMSGAAGAAEEISQAVEDLAGALGDIGGGLDIDFEAILNEAAIEFNSWLHGNGPNDFHTIWADAWNVNFVDPNSPFQKALNSMREAWKGLWDDFAKTAHLPSWDEIMSAWNMPTTTGRERGKDKEFAVNTPSLIDRIQSVLNTFSESIKTNGGIIKTLQDIAGWIWQTLIDFIANVVSPVSVPTGTLGMENFNPGTSWDRIIGKFSEIGSSIAQGILDGITDKISNYDWNGLAWDFIKNSLLTAFDITGFISGWATLNGTTIMDSLAGAMVDTANNIDWIKTVWSIITGSFKIHFKNGSPSKLFEEYGGDIIDGLKNGFVNTINSLVGPEGSITKAISGFIDSIKSFFGIGGTTAETNPFIQIGNNIVDGIKTGIENMEGTLRTAIEWIVSKLPLWAQKLLGMASPSKVFMKIGENTVLGLVKGIESSSDMIKKTMLQTVGNTMMNPALSAPMSAAPVYGNTVNFGDVHINNDMDWAVFKAQVQRAIIED
jgi:hypothetical protein